jgi:small-conductance mechanosensitive channel
VLGRTRIASVRCACVGESERLPCYATLILAFWGMPIGWLGTRLLLYSFESKVLKILPGFFIPEENSLPTFLRNWGEDTRTFLRHDAPKILLVLIGVFVVIRLLRLITRKVPALQARRLPPGVTAAEARTLAGVISNIGVSIIVFVAALEILPMLGLNVGPLIASAGVAGLAIGFGAQTLVHDFINGFFILLDRQYDIGDYVRVAGVKGTVEEMTLRHTALRDDDGTLHFVPNSQITIVSNTTRDWSQLTLRVVVAYSEPSARIINLLQQIGDEIRNDPQFATEIMSNVQIPGIDRVGNGEAEYLMLVKTRPTKQAAVSRELQRRIKECFEKNQVQTGAQGRLYVLDSTTKESRST